MAETAKELAFALFDEGKRPSNPEVKALGLKTKTTYDYYQRWKRARSEKEGTIDESSRTTGKPGTPTTPITVGKITVTPENGGFTKYRTILILDTYKNYDKNLVGINGAGLSLFDLGLPMAMSEVTKRGIVFHAG